MKKYFKILFYSFLLISLAGCQSNMNEENSELKEKALRNTQEIIDNQFDEVIEQAHKDIGISSTQLKYAYEGVVIDFGDFDKIVDSKKVYEDAGGVVFEQEVKYENGTLTVILGYDAKNSELIAIYFNHNKNIVLETNSDVFLETEIIIGENELKGVLTTPKDTKNYPVVVLVHGSGPNDYNETISVNTPFKDIAHKLAQYGIATIRYNKATYQNPYDFLDEVTIYTETINDAIFAIDYAQENVSEDVFLIGHSLGGMAAPKIASLTENLQGFVMLGGSNRHLYEIIYDQHYQTISQSYEDDEAQAQYAVLDAMLKTVEAFEEGDEGNFFGMDGVYFASLFELNDEDYIKNSKVPVLILQAKEDFQVTYENDYLPMLQAYLDTEHVDLIAYDGLNHLFMPQMLNNKDINLQEYDFENKVSDEVIEDIADFINK